MEKKDGYYSKLRCNSVTTRCGFGCIQVAYSNRKKCNVYYGSIIIKKKRHFFHDVDKEKVEKWLEEMSKGLDQYMLVKNPNESPPKKNDTVNYKELSLKKEHFKRYEQIKRERILNGYSYGEE